jgi:hypothetical protein
MPEIKVSINDRRYTEKPVCPFCGHVEQDAWEIDFPDGLESSTELYCNHCGECYFVERHCSVSYSTDEIKRKK